jgi:hypothetical protein
MKIKKTKYPFKYGNCVLCCLTSVTGKDSVHFRKYGIGQRPVENEVLMECLMNEFPGLVLMKNKGNLTIKDLCKLVEKKSNYIAVYDNHIMHFKRNQIIDTYAVIHKKTILNSIPSHIIKLL